MANRMTETGYRYGVCALRAKRAEIAGDIAQLKLQVRHRQRDLAGIDAVLRVLAPDSDPATIPTKRPVKYLNLFRQGELGRLVLGVLRASGQPMTNLEITQAVMDRDGYDKSAWTPLRRRIRANLAYLEAQGRIAKVGIGKDARWRMTTPRTSVEKYHSDM